jgi:protein-disulfide isomerase
MSRLLPLDLNQFDACRANLVVAARVQSNQAAAQSLGISGTPTFLIGHVQADRTVKVVLRLAGAQKLPALLQAVEGLLTASMRSN